MREFPEEKESVIQEYEKFCQLFAEDRLEFESESKKAVENLISKAENEETKINLKRLQERWSHTLINVRNL